MKIIITSRNAETIETWQRVIPVDPAVSFETALRAEGTVDAVLMAGVFAHQRYGGRPGAREAQIIDNRREDGWPPLVIVPPTRPIVTDGEGGTRIDPEFQGIKPTYYAASHVFAAVARWNARHTHAIATVEVNLPLLDMDTPSDKSSPRSFAEALLDHRRHG
jgi:hypothetical protein